MQRRGDCYWSEASRLAYPIIGGIPVLREESAIYATGFAELYLPSPEGRGAGGEGYGVER